MQMTLLVASLSLLAATVTASANAPAKVKIDISDDRQRYSIHVRFDESVTHFDTNSIRPASEYFGPWGVRVHVRDAERRLLSGTHGIACFDLGSDYLTGPDFQSVPNDHRLAVRDQKLSDVMCGLNLVTRVPRSEWKQAKLVFQTTVRLRTGCELAVRGESEWFDLPMEITSGN